MYPTEKTPPKADKSRVIIGILLTLVLAGGVVSFLTATGQSQRPMFKNSDVISITLPPPPLPPPPPPPPPPPTPKDQEMVQQDPVTDDEPPPDNSPPEAAPVDLSTGITGNGPDMGLTRGSGNHNIGGSGRRNGSKFGWYAAKVQSSITEALRHNPATRNSTMSLQVRIWSDTDGRITRAQLVGTTGNPTIDDTIKNQVLTGFQLPQAPPADMPMPINMRITARKALQ